jgi:organic hydroperoxide reductase OsmC/OhrA
MLPKYYETNLKWKSTRKGELTLKGKAPMEVTDIKFTNDELQIWSAEDLYVASVNVSFMSSFLQEANNTGVPVISFESRAIGVTERLQSGLILSEIIVEPKILILNGTDWTKVLHLISTAESNCLIANSMKTKVIIQPKIDYKIMEEIL